MEKFSLLLFAFALISSGLADDDDVCVNEDKRECTRVISRIFRDTPFISDEVLSNNCSDIQRSYDCTLDFIRSCHEDELDEFLLLTTSPKQLLDDLCIETSAIRTAYREHVSCLKSEAVMTGLLVCLVSIGETAFQKLKDEGREFESKEEKYEYACLFYEPFKSCFGKVADDNCEEGAGELMKELLDRVTELPREKFCNSPLSEPEDVANSVFEEMTDEIVELFKRRK